MGNFKENFNFYSNIFILLIFFFGGIIWADTNGVWIFAKDIRGGIFGADEQVSNMNFTFINPVYFGEKILSLEQPLTYFLNISGRSQLNDLATNKISTNSLTLPLTPNCNGKLVTDFLGNVKCDVDNVIDGDSSSTNELQTISRTGF